MRTGKSFTKYRTVLVCAWCNPDHYQALKIGEVYSHGICEAHKMRMLSKGKFA